MNLWQKAPLAHQYLASKESSNTRVSLNCFEGEILNRYHILAVIIYQQYCPTGRLCNIKGLLVILRVQSARSNGKLNFANSCWQEKVGGCERCNDSWQIVGENYRTSLHSRQLFLFANLHST